MDERDILNGIEAVAREHLGRTGPVDPNMRLVEELELDSLRRLTLVVEIENRFRICLEDKDEAAIETVGDLVRVIGRRLDA